MLVSTCASNIFTGVVATPTHKHVHTLVDMNTHKAYTLIIFVRTNVDSVRPG